MQKEECVGCKTHFEEGCKLPMEGLSIELKNYPIPIKDQKHRWVLLKTICSLLNSKGGTIFIGADDSTGEVRGVSIQRKDRDDFKIFIQQLSERIQPKVDLSDRQDIVVQFAPVLAKGKFQGKYLIKIIIKQGEPAQLYCFNQKIQMYSSNDKKQQYQIVYSYKRMNMGNIKQLKGYQLVVQAKNKAAKPFKIADCFHQGCNPQPLNLQIQILKLGFSNVPQQMRQILQQWFQKFLQQLKIQDFSVLYDPENDMIVVQLPTKNQFVKVEEFVSKNIKQLNENLEGLCQFVKKDTYLGCYLYENTIKQIQNQNMHENIEQKKQKKYKKKQKKQKTMTEQSSTQQPPKICKKQEKQPASITSSQKQSKDSSKKQVKQIQKQVQKKQQKPLKSSREGKKQQEHRSMQQKPSPKKMSKKFSITFTHINPKAKQSLVHFLQAMVESYKSFETYQNTVQMFLPNNDAYQDALQAMIVYGDSLSQFGFKGDIRYGVNIGQISIINFDRTKQKKFQDYLKKLIGKQVSKIEARIKGNRCSMEIIFTSKQSACQWLDRLLTQKSVKDFKIPGSQNGKMPKMKVFLNCIKLEDAFEFQYCDME